MIKDSHEYLERAKYKMQNNIRINQPGVSGLVNIGNTCYMNATLQNLLSTDILAVYLIGVNGNAAYKNDLEIGCINQLIKEHKCERKDITKKQSREKFENSFTYALRNLFLIMWSENCSVRPETFKSTLDKCTNMFHGHAQQDADEFLTYVLDKVHEETKSDVSFEVDLSEEEYSYIPIYENYINTINNESISKDEKRECLIKYMNYRKNKLRIDAIITYIFEKKKFLKNNHSVIMDIFHGSYLSQKKCSICENIKFNFEPFSILQLQILKSHSKRPFTSLEECLDDYFTYDQMNGREVCFCEYCDKKCEAISKTDLWVSPQRLIIQLKRFTSSSQKIDTTIDFPIENLNLTKYVSQYSPEEYVYDLYGVIFHSGSFKFGHYVGFTKNPANGVWYLYNDSSVVELDDHTLKKQFNNSGPYILLYKKRGEDV